MILFVILLSILMILLSTLSMIRHSYSKYELASELESDLQVTLDWVLSGFLILMLEKLSWFRLTGLITLVLLL